MSTKLKDLAPILVRNYFAAVPTYIRGKPALGKTETIQAFALKMQERMKDRGEGDFKLWQFYAPTMSPMDIQASAPNYDTGKLDMFNNAALPNAYDETEDHKIKGIIFFGELPNTDPTTIKLLQKYVNGEDMSGSLRKPAGVQVIVDGNRIEDKSGVQQQGRAFLSRFEHIEVYADAQDNMDFAGKNAWHPNVQTFFKEHPAAIDNYDEVFETSSSTSQRSSQAKQANGGGRLSEEGRQGIWANMRSWERISRKEYAADELKTVVSLSELVGNLGSGVGAAYHAHKEFLGKLSSFDDIMADPANVKIPDRMDEQYILSLLVAMRCTEAQLPLVREFGKRMPPELQAVILKNLACRPNFTLTGTAAYRDWIADTSVTSLINGR